MKDERLKRYLDSINFESTMYSFFEDFTLEKVVINKKKNTMTIYINMDELIPIYVYIKLYESSLTFKNANKVYFVFHVKNSNKYLKEYTEYYYDKLVLDSPMLASIDKDAITYENNIIDFEVINKIEEKKILSLKDKLLSFLSCMGFDVSLKVHINLEARKELQDSINSTKELFLKEEDDIKIIKGSFIRGKIEKISNLIVTMKDVVAVCYFFSKKIDYRKDWIIITVKASDNIDSINGKIFYKKEFIKECEDFYNEIKLNTWYKIKGNVSLNNYNSEYEIAINDIETYPKKEKKFVDNEEVKRVELHAHTMMSQMDSVVKLDLKAHTCELITNAINMGYKAVAITDHHGCQAFPICYDLIKSYNKKQTDESKKFKGLYGLETIMVNDNVDIVIRGNDNDLLETTYVVFDTETTGFNAAGSDQMIEIGAVKIHDGKIIDTFDMLINPGRKLPSKIVELTSITDEMLKDKESEEEVVKKFLEFASIHPLVAHNAKFDMSFLESAIKKYKLKEITNPIIDTLELSRGLDSSYAHHNLSTLVKRYDIEFDELSHHRADYDAKATALVFYKMLKKVKSMGYKTINDLEKLVSIDDIYKFGKPYHVNMIAMNQKGLKNLFKIISLANTKYLYKTPRIPRSVLSSLREGLLIGSSCYESEVFVEAKSKEGEELSNVISFYDYVEVQSPEVYDHLIQKGDFSNYLELKSHIKKIIDSTKEAGKIIVATGDVHHFYKEDLIYRKIIINQKVPGGGLHPLNNKSITEIPSQHFRTTSEMLSDFDFLGKDLAYEIVVTNTNKVADMVDHIDVIIDTKGVPFSPRVRSDDGKGYLDCPKVLTEIALEKAISLYGSPLPNNIIERIALELYGEALYNYWTTKLNRYKNKEDFADRVYKNLYNTIEAGFDEVKKCLKEVVLKKNKNLKEEEIEAEIKSMLGGIIGGGFDPIYIIAQRLVKNSNDEGYIVGSRGSVGSSFVATLLGITEVNPLPTHYRCPNCKLSIFEDENGSLSNKYSCGPDLPDKKCPNCKTLLEKDGQDMPFATFLGFNADKVPDIDLNFSDLNQASAHEYTKVLFGEDNVYRAGTIGTAAEKTAFGFVKGYFEDNNIYDVRSAEIERLALGCTGVKRTTGQHPGGIVVVPDYMDVYDFTPYQYPADDPNSAWKTTHFDYNALEDNLLKLDILGHSDPTQLRLIQEMSKTDVTKVPLDDIDTMSIFLSPKVLDVTEEEINCPTGTLGVPEFGTPLAIQTLTETKPTTFSELVKISGLSHGTGVWGGNAQDLVLNKIVEFKDVIGCRDDIMIYLIQKGLSSIDAFNIMEFVRKGKAKKDPDKWNSYIQKMKEAKIEDWYIDSCGKIEYMFPKAHASAYVTSAFRIAWYKVHMPSYFYASWFSTKAVDFDIDSMLEGYSSIKNKIDSINNSTEKLTNKDKDILETSLVALECTARGIKINNLDLYKSKCKTFEVIDENNILPSWTVIEGLGETVGNNIVAEAAKKPFISIEDFQERCKVSQTVIDKMRGLGIFNDLPESSQLTIFDFGEL